ncbi:hypothetical protein [Actinophytocola sp.]|uniref:hypothetical protein n=1 Tax=Actinophytocola sp. TaxID=1872138 RepID=UPI003D6BBDA5
MLDHGYETILYVQQLRQAALLAEALGGEYAEHAPGWRQRADAAAEALSAVLWNPDAGAFLSSLTESCHPTYGNAIAVTGSFGAAAGLSPSVTTPRRVDAILDHLTTYVKPWGYGGSDDGDACPFFEFSTEDLVYGQSNAYVANALYQAGRRRHWMCCAGPTAGSSTATPARCGRATGSAVAPTASSAPT